MVFLFLVILGLSVPSCFTKIFRVPLNISTVASYHHRLPLILGASEDPNLHTDKYGRYKIYYTDEKTIGIGTPPQYFKFGISSMHSSIVAYSSKECVGCGHHKRYDASSSKTSNKTKEWIGIQEWLGSYYGYYTYDDITLQGKKVKTRALLEVDHCFSSYYPTAPFDAEIGICPYSKLYEGMEQSKEFDRSVISLSLSKDGGEIIFGGSDPAYNPKEIIYVPRYMWKGNGFWTFMLDQFLVNGNLLAGPCYMTVGLLVQKTMIPRHMIPELAKLLGAVKHEGDSDYKVKCDLVDSLPPIVFTTKTGNLTMHAKDYVLQDRDHAGYCFLAIDDRYPYNGDDCYMLVGDQFLTAFYMELDYSNQRIGLAENKN